MKEGQKATVTEPPAEEEIETTKLANEKKSKAEKSEAEVEKELPKGPPKTIIREYFESLVVTVIMALFGITFILQAVKVPTGSMQNTIMIGDHLLVNKFTFAPGKSFPLLPQREIRLGDIIVFKYPGNKYDPSSDLDPSNIPYKTNYVKRVIGLPNDKIEIRGLQVFVNDKPLPEQIIEAESPEQIVEAESVAKNAPLNTGPIPPLRPDELYTVYYSPTSIFQVQEGLEPYRSSRFAGFGNPAIVPPDSYFVMGDNRDNSADGRYWGFVQRDLIIGKAMFVYWSYDESKSSRGNPISNFLFNTRWSRTGTRIK